jgi:tetratricopeptide (TPR) repeat protein
MAMLDPGTWREASRYLDEAWDLPPAERASWLAALEAHNPAILGVVARLLDVDQRVTEQRFLEEEVPAAAMATAAVIGGYRLIKPIGEGGMGTVWLAERSDGRYEGRAAIKFLSAGLIGHVVQERFTREGSILAKLSHPSIAHLADAGVTAAGQPYLVLEYVDGDPIDHYCEREKLGVDQRVQLFLDVLAPVAHAHTNLVVHRDLKPSNVMVTRDGRVKLLDFGIAKLLQDEAVAREATAITRGGGGAMTPAYAAPEQIIGGAITTATDIYALGCLLYLLLSGRHHAGDAVASPAALIEAILHRDPPPLGITADLDLIVGKALKKEPSERYGSVTAFADDLVRYLRDEPITARRDSLTYRTRKFIRRNRTAAALTSLVLLTLIGGLIGTVTQANRATEQARLAQGERDFAQRQLFRAAAMNELNAFLLTESEPAGATFTPVQMLTKAEEAVHRQHAQDPATRADLLVALGSQFGTLDEAEHQRRIMIAAYDLARQVDDPAIRARAACGLGNAVSIFGEAQRGETLVREGLALLTGSPQHLLARVFCHICASRVAVETNPASALEHAQAAERLLNGAPNASSLMHLRAAMELARTYGAVGRATDADAMFARAYEGLKVLGYERTDTAETLLNNWALLLEDLGRPLEAEVLYRRMIEFGTLDGTDARVSAFVLNNFARLLEGLARYDEALVHATRAFEKARRAGNNVILMQALIARARLSRLRGDLAQAEATLQEIESRAKTQWGPGHPGYIALFAERADLARARGDLDAASALIDKSVGLLEATSEKFGLPRILLRRAAISLDRQEADRARDDAERALKALLAESPSGGLSGFVARAALTLGRALAMQGRHAEAREALTTAVRHSPALGDNHPDAIAAAQMLAKMK